MPWLLANWRLLGMGALLAALGTMWLLLKAANAEARAASARLDGLVTDLEAQRQQTVAMAERVSEEARARWEAERRERALNTTRRTAAQAARTEHERITAEIMQALGAEACNGVFVPVDAVDSLRDYAAYANGIRDDLPGSVPSDSLDID